MTPFPPFRAGASQDERDAAYDNTRAVADSAALIAARNAASEVFRAAHPGHLDLPYAPGERTKWDLFPAAGPGAPCLVFVHGGYWQRNRREDFCVLAEGALARGWSFALPGYTLAPDASLTRIVAEIHAALDWLQANGAGHGIAGRVVLSGWSAGGHLAAACAGHPLVSAALAISGIFDLAPIRDTYLNDKLRLTEAEIEALSPLRQPPVGKPMAIAYGSAELPELRRQSRHFHGARAEAHLPGPLVPVARADHFRILDALREPDGELLRAADDLLKHAA
ncbi:alpha/beta hydrolase [Paracraurococcus ruber]|uniref:Alpha/beta hydrolase n=1 Tax=Paracraurococcus ruber TaxID=77675 RepID=A0ABS1D0S4_9PROT|nr:alpha/beta hydrolase [Paracraurococcus ruber]MBK1660389.1 alpha/beta hydrolase [Paracraurococcus ruber]TDG27895.1 alpha/beta hydrolase [Paracraurococcus ruber]